MRRTDITDGALCEAIAEMAAGLIDADLGGGIVKKRIANSGRGKRGGSRLLVATNKRDRWFFVFGFEKNEQGNISAAELTALQAYAAELLRLSIEELDRHVHSEALYEICESEEHESDS